MTDRDRKSQGGPTGTGGDGPSDSQPFPREERNRPGSERRFRRRWEITGGVSLTIYVDSEGPGTGSETSKLRLIREGVTKDLSVTGVCVLIEDSVLRFPLPRVVGRNVKLRLSLPTLAEKRINLLGRIAWAKEESSLIRIGVQFTDVQPAERRALERCCRADEGELNRICHLWELLVAEPRPEPAIDEGK